jgi:endonuclease VIII
MPEGDTVWLAAKRMHEALAGRVVSESDFRVPQLATASLAGQTVTEVVARGKHLLTRTDAGLTLHTHFLMDGTWKLFRAGQRWTGGPGHQIRAVLGNAEWTAVGYRLHEIELVPTAEEDRLVGHLGPDTCSDAFDLDEAVRRVGARPEREVGPALLDQRNLAGIGNLYKTEVLFLRGLTPWTPVGEVTDLRRLVDLGRRLIHANRARWEQATTGDTRRGREHWVFERGGRACRRCGSRILVAEQVEPEQPAYGRLCYWCPRCQRGPAPSTAT